MNHFSVMNNQKKHLHEYATQPHKYFDRFLEIFKTFSRDFNFAISIMDYLGIVNGIRSATFVTLIQYSSFLSILGIRMSYLYSPS